MPSIFVSYRRAETDWETGRLCDALSREFGDENIFHDVDSIRAGSDFTKVITEQILTSHVLLVVIGKAWLSITGANGIRRLDDPEDFVRIEIETALTHNIPVIPVLIGGSIIPKKEDLPEGLRQLANLQAVLLRGGADWKPDAERLNGEIKTVTASVSERPAQIRHYRHQ